MARNGVCKIADQNCKAAANFEIAGPVTVCFACGDDVCVECSTLREYHNHGRKRLCHDCETALDGNDKRVRYRLARRAGYTHKQAKEYAQ